VAWGRLSAPNGAPAEGDGSSGGSRPIRSTPVSIYLREHADLWMTLAPERSRDRLSSNARAVLEVLDRRGASFFAELVSGSGILPTQVEQALAELAAVGLVTSDSFVGLRALLVPSARRKTIPGAPRRQRTVGWDIGSAGRWSRTSGEGSRVKGEGELPSGEIEGYARILLRRYGIVFNRLLARESVSVPWRDLLRVYRRLEARGEIRGGRFVAGVTGEQFALPDAVARLRAVRRAPKKGQLLAVSAADPLNLLGIVGPGERIAALTGNRIVFEDGVPLAVLEKGRVRVLADYGPDRALGVERALARRPVSPALRARLGIPGRTPHDSAGAPWRRRPSGAPQA
jgi:ATP-dependent Lhr-like helicase